MAIAFNAVTTGTTAGATTLTFSHTPAGSDRLLVVNAGCGSASATLTATFNGVAMTQITTLNTNFRHTAFYLFAPSASTADVVITSTISTDIEGVATSYTGCLQSSSVIDGFNSGQNAGNAVLNVSITTSNTGTWGVSCAGTDTNDIPSVDSQTSRGSIGTNAPALAIYDTNASLTSGSNTASMPNNGGLYSNQLIYFGIREGGAAPATNSNFLMFM